MKKVKNSETGKGGTSRREFLRKIGQSGSIVALIGSGFFDAELRRLMAAEATRKTLSRQALEGALPEKSLEMIRNLLKGEYFPGGRFFMGTEGKWFPKDPPCVAVITEGSRGNVQGVRCATNPCDEEVCLDISCGFNPCDDQICGGIADRCKEWSLQAREVDTRKTAPFNFADVNRFPSEPFVKELMEVMDLKSTKELEAEIKNMVQKRQTLKSRGYVK